MRNFNDYYKTCDIYYKDNCFYIVSFTYKSLGNECNYDTESEPMVKASVTDSPEEIGKAILLCLNSYKEETDSQEKFQSDELREKLAEFFELSSSEYKFFYKQTEETMRCFHFFQEANYFELADDNDVCETFDGTYVDCEELGKALLKFVK